jgi:hypothetical protein
MSTSIRNWNEFLKFVDDVYTGKGPEIKLSGIDTTYSVPIKVSREGNDRISVDRGSFTNLCAECFVRGENSMYDEWLDAYKSGSIKTEEDVVRLVEHMHGVYREAKDRILELEAKSLRRRKKRRTAERPEAELVKAYRHSNSWEQMGRELRMTGKTAKDLWHEYCGEKGIAFKDRFPKPSE